MAADLTTFEHHTLKVPYEALNKRFRTTQKVIEREVSHLNSAIDDFNNKVTTRASAQQLLDQFNRSVLPRLKALRKRADENVLIELDIVDTCRKRTDHLQSALCDDMEDRLLQFKQCRVDRLVVEYLVRQGYYESAMALSESAGICDLTNANLFTSAKEVEKALIVDHDTSLCHSWIYDNKTKLKKIKSTLEFELRLQEFIELVKQGKKLEAVKHARQNFATATDGQGTDAAPILARIQQAMLLLVVTIPNSDPDSPELDTRMDESPSNRLAALPQYASLLNPNRWGILVRQFRTELCRIYQLAPTSTFVAVLQAGLAGLKTNQCCVADRSDTVAGAEDVQMAHSAAKTDTGEWSTSVASETANPPTDVEMIDATDEDEDSSSRPATLSIGDAQAATIPPDSVSDESAISNLANTVIVDLPSLSDAPTPTERQRSREDRKRRRDVRRRFTEQCCQLEAMQRTVRCPVCHRAGQELARDLPFAHASQSHLICRMSGEVMNENNQPMAMPNGQVYGEKALRRMAATTSQILAEECANAGEGGQIPTEDGTQILPTSLVVCPQTGQIYKFAQLEKVYVM